MGHYLPALISSTIISLRTDQTPATDRAEYTAQRPCCHEGTVSVSRTMPFFTSTSMSAFS